MSYYHAESMIVNEIMAFSLDIHIYNSFLFNFDTIQQSVVKCKSIFLYKNILFQYTKINFTLTFNWGNYIMKKTIIIFFSIVLGIIFISWFNESNWNPADYARITAVDYKAEIVDEPGSNGKVIITEQLTFDIHAASQSNLFWELWRDLPEAYIDGVKVDYKVNSVKQIFDDGSDDVIYQESPILYWEDYDYINTAGGFGPEKWYHSEGPYSESLRQYECVLFYVDGLYREEVVFEIEYEMYNAALRYSDSSELYLTPYSEETINFLDSFKGQILIPNANMPKEGNYNAYTYGTNSHTFPFTESKSVNPGYHTFSFELDKSQLKFKPYNEYIEFTLVSYGPDKHIFTEYASQNDYYFDNVLSELQEEQAKYEALPNNYKTMKYIILILSIAGTVITLIVSLNADKIISKKHVFYKPSRTFEYYREIPSNLDSNFATALVFCKHKSSDIIQDGYAATLLSLVRKRYIELEKIKPQADWLFENVKIVVKYRPVSEENTTVLEPLTLTEEQYFNLIMRHSHGIEIPMDTFQNRVSFDYEYTNTFVRNVKNAIINIGISQGYFQKVDYQQPRNQMRKWSIALGITGIILITVVNLILSQTRLDLAFGSFFILGIGFVISAIPLNKLSSKCVLLTQFGEDEYAKWRGLYNYFNSKDFMKDKTVEDLTLWEQYLIYATAFGVSEKVNKSLSMKWPDASSVLSNPYYRSRRFHHSHHSFRTATRSASFTARSGGHGGYGGGGRGGGGGGGGH